MKERLECVNTFKRYFLILYMKRKYIKKVKPIVEKPKIEKPKTDKVDKVKKVIIVRFDD